MRLPVLGQTPKYGIQKSRIIGILNCDSQSTIAIDLIILLEFDSFELFAFDPLPILLDFPAWILDVSRFQFGASLTFLHPSA